MNLEKELNTVDIIFSVDNASTPPPLFNQLFTLKFTNSFSVSHINARSLNKNFDDFRLLYENCIEGKFQIIGVSETWRINNPNLVNMPTYSLELDCRTHGRGGGVGAYIHSSLSYKILNFDVKHAESLWMEIAGKKNRIVIGVLYRKPGTDISEFEISLCNVLCKVKLEKKHFILMGDFNIDTMKSDTISKNFISRMQCLHLNQLISVTTRISNNSASTIDHIYTNICSCKIYAGTIIADLSDHFPVFSLFEHFNIHFPIVNSIYSRDFKNYKRDS